MTIEATLEKICELIDRQNVLLLASMTAEQRVESFAILGRRALTAKLSNVVESVSANADGTIDAQLLVWTAADVEKMRGIALELLRMANLRAGKLDIRVRGA